jgi:hypothetical protein
MTTPNNVHRKLQAVRHEFVLSNVKKTGKNKFAGYEYFELGDFIPTVHRLFDAAGLIGVVQFKQAEAMLTVYNSDMPEEFLQFTSPIVFASNPKGQPIQDLGSTHTYMRRYLWLLAMEITEHDSVDSSAPIVKQEPKVAEKKQEEVKAEPVEKAETPESQAFLVDKLIEHALVAESKVELANLWKGNQKQIDVLKKSYHDQFTRLQTAFSEMKSNLEE